VKHVANLLKGTKLPKKKGIDNSEPLPAVTPAPPSQGLTAVDWGNKAGALWDGKKYTDQKLAIEYLNNAIKLKQDFVDAYNNRGIAYASLGQYQQAIEDYNKAIRLQPDFAVAYNNRGVAYDSLHQYQQAIEDYNKAIRLKLDFFDAYYNRANDYERLNRHERAIEDYNEAIRLKPTYAVAYYKRGFAYNNLEQYQRAIENLNEAIRLKPDYALAYFCRGGAYLAQGNNNLFCRDAKKACELGSLGGCSVFEYARGKGNCR
jgi:tetratricopeptide (TPR) repeat protein